MCACVHVWQSNSHLRVSQVCEVDIAVVASRREVFRIRHSETRFRGKRTVTEISKSPQLLHRVRQLRQRDLQTRYSRCCCLFTGDFSFLATRAALFSPRIHFIRYFSTGNIKLFCRPRLLPRGNQFALIHWEKGIFHRNGDGLLYLCKNCYRAKNIMSTRWDTWKDIAQLYLTKSVTMTICRSYMNI